MTRPILTLLLLCSLRCHAAIINAATCGSGDVTNALASAVSNDIVQMPAGSATWTNAVSVGTGKILRGAGIGVTVIHQAVGGGNAMSVGSYATVSNFTFAAADSGAADRMITAGSAQDFRIAFMVISNVAVRGIETGGGSTGKHAQGVIDHCTLVAKSYGSPGLGTFQLVIVQGGESDYPPNDNQEAGSLYYAPGLGSSNAVFVENCVISQNAQGDSSIETYTGGKVVVRHCLMTNFFLGVHGNDSSLRSGHSVEVYNNTNWVNLGSSMISFVISRGGTGLVYSNTITHPSSSVGNAVTLQSYRSAGQLAVDEPDYTQRFPYNMGQLSGQSKYDGNTTNGIAVAMIHGVHDGSTDAPNLTNTAASWGADAFLGTGDYATDNNLQTYYIWNRTDGSRGRISGNTATSVIATLSGGTQNDWDVGDEYVITFGYPGLDQNGWAGPTRFLGTYATQVLTPWYQWSNTWNDAAGLSFSVDFLGVGHTAITQPQSDQFIQANREYYNATPMPGYTPYTYPHPLTVTPSTRTLTTQRGTAGTLRVYNGAQ